MTFLDKLREYFRRPVAWIGLAFFAILLVLLLGGCDPATESNKTAQARKAKEAAESITFTQNAEIDNIKRRLQLTSQPGKLGFIILLNQAGQPILYEGVKGKVTSGSKRLTTTDYVHTGVGWNGLRQAASDEGTYGSSDSYIYYWNTEDVYRQWSGAYLYSDQPFRLTTQPLVVTMTAKQFAPGN